MNEAEKAAAEKAAPDKAAAEKKEAETKPENSSPLMKEALGRYGIKPEHVLASKDYGKYVAIVTRGGVKVSYTRGDKVEELSDLALTGQPKPKAKPKK